MTDVVKVDRAGAGDLCHHTFEELGGGLAQDLWSDNGEDRGGDGKEHDDQDQNFICAEILDQLAQGTFEVARLFAFHHRHGTAAGSMRAAHLGLCLLEAGSSCLHAFMPIPPCSICDKAMSR